MPPTGVQQRGLAPEDGARRAAGRGAGGEAGFQAVGVPEGVDHHGLDAGFDQAVERVVQQRLAAEGQQRLGGVARSAGACAGRGRRRAAWRCGDGWSCGEALRVGALVRWDPAVHRGGERRRGGMAQRRCEQLPSAGSVREVVRPPVAKGKAHPLAGDAEVPLGGTNGVGGVERVGVKVRPGGQMGGDAEERAERPRAAGHPSGRRGGGRR